MRQEQTAGAAPRLRLGADTVHVWHLDPEAAGIDHAVCWNVLAADERQTYERLRAPNSRQQYLVSHALLRTVLSRYAPLPPSAWIFETTRHGRPEIAAPRGMESLRFNLSHTRGRVACAVTLRRDIGVDVEQLRTMPRHLALAHRFFAPAEAAALDAWPAAGRDTRFLEYWTLKESYIKARGLGLSLPLRRFAFDLAGTPVRVSFDAELDDQPERWQFGLFRPTPAHVLAVAVKRAGTESIDIELKEAVPGWA